MPDGVEFSERSACYMGKNFSLHESALCLHDLPISSTLLLYAVFHHIQAEYQLALDLQYEYMGMCLQKPSYTDNKAEDPDMRVFVRDDITTTLSKAMDGLSLRHCIIADNIANVDTPGFKAKDVCFEEELSSAIARGKPESAKQVIYECTGKTRSDGNSVDIHMETQKIAETTVLYAAMSRLISERFSLLRSVITEGRR